MNNELKNIEKYAKNIMSIIRREERDWPSTEKSIAEQIADMIPKKYDAEDKLYFNSIPKTAEQKMTALREREMRGDNPYEVTK